MYDIKTLVKETVYLKSVSKNGIIYETESGFLFTIPLSDIGNLVCKNEDKAVYYIKFIRKAL